jgi:hypothetical protein
MARGRAPRPGALNELPPLRIARQIALLQALFYLVAGGLTLFAVLVAGRPFGLGLVLGWRSLRGDTTLGYVLALVCLLDGVAW